MRTSNPLLVTIAAALVAAGPVAAQEADGDGWDWVVAPYVWVASINTDLDFERPPVEDEDHIPGLIDNLDFAALLHAEGQGDQFGALADLTFVALSDSGQRSRSSTDTSLDLALLDVAAVWSPGETRYEGFEGFAGVRYIDGELEVEFDPVNAALPDVRRTLDKSFSDFLIGVRYGRKLSDRWGLNLRGDGSFGSTDGTYNASAHFQYRAWSGAWLFGYRYMIAKLPIGDDSVELTLDGPVVSYAFKF